MNESPKNLIAPKRHSRLGIASIIIGVVIIAIGVLWYLMSRLFFEQMFGPGRIDSVAHFTLSSIAIAIVFALLHLVGVGLGIAGWVSKKTKNVFPVIGTFFNLLLIIGDILLILWWGFFFVIATAPVH